MRPSRQQLIKRILVYSFMSISVVVIVTLLMLAVLGYSFNTKDNRLEQGGLLQFESVPSGATVVLDEMQLGSRTPSKTTAEAHDHTITMTLDGYRSWSKAINLHAGQIGWLSYARLIPTDPKAVKLRAAPTLAATLASPDRKWLALLEDITKPTIVIANLQNDNVTYTDAVLPSTSYTPPSPGKTQTFALDSWTQDGQYLLVRHTYDDTKTEWLLVNPDDQTKTKDISTRLGLSSSKVVFSSHDGKTALAVTDGAVRRLNLSDETISRPLVANIAEFSAYSGSDNTLLYVTAADPATKQRSTGYMTSDMDVAQQLGTFPDDGKPLHLAMADYFGQRYVATSYGSTIHVSAGNLPKGDDKGSLKSVITFNTQTLVQRLSFSTNGRFVIAETGTSYVVYDLELAKTSTTMLKNATDPVHPLRWIDAYMTWYDAGGMLRLYEFDGANQQNLVPVAEGFDVVVSPNQKYLYSVGRDASGLFLQRVQMVLK